jgi:hypothetical protein
MSALAAHCPQLQTCNIGHQISESEFRKEDLKALIQGCPNLESVGSQNGIEISTWSLDKSPLLNALREAGGDFDVDFRVQNTIQNVEVVVRSLIDKPGLFNGCLHTYPYVYAADRDAQAKALDKAAFDSMAAQLTIDAEAAGFSVSMGELEWFD